MQCSGTDFRRYCIAHISPVRSGRGSQYVRTADSASRRRLITPVRAATAPQSPTAASASSDRQGEARSDENRPGSGDADGVGTQIALPVGTRVPTRCEWADQHCRSSARNGQDDPDDTPQDRRPRPQPQNRPRRVDAGAELAAAASGCQRASRSTGTRVRGRLGRLQQPACGGHARWHLPQRIFALAF